MQKKPLIIAEIGTSHGGDFSRAAELVAAAAEAGADCVKTQIVVADEILHPATGAVPLPGGAIQLYDAFKKLERPPEFYARLKEEAEKRRLLFLASVFGPRSAALLKQLNPEAAKIASPELNYGKLISETASWGVRLFLSTGVSRLADIEAALEWACAAGLPREKVCLLHCVTAYPAPPEDYNLHLMEHLAEIFGCACGVSDHSLDPVLVPSLAASLGAAAIEKHLCLSRADAGLDDLVALPPADFERMTVAIKMALKAPIHGGDYRDAQIEAVLGDGVKRLAPSEAANYERTRRSLHALADIAAGEIIDETKCAPLRTEKVLRPGLPPDWAEKIAGKPAKQAIPAGEGIRLEDVF